MSTNSSPSKEDSQKPPPLGLQNNGTVADTATVSGPPSMQTTTSAEEPPAQQALDLDKAAQPQPGAQSHDALEVMEHPAPSQVKDLVATKPPASKPAPVASVLEHSGQENPTTKATPGAEFGKGGNLQGRSPVSFAPDSPQAPKDSTSAELPDLLQRNVISVQEEEATKTTDEKLLSDQPRATDDASASTVSQSAAQPESTTVQTLGSATTDSVDSDQPPQLNDGATSVDDQQDSPSNPSGIGNNLQGNFPTSTKGPSLVTADSSAVTLVDDKNVPRIAKTAAAKSIEDESLAMASKQPPAPNPKTDAIAKMPTDITQTMDFNAAMIAISKLADQTKPNKTSEPAPPASKTSSVSSENKYASLFAPKAGQWDSWQQHVRATAAKQQKAIEAAVAQQQQALASAATQANPIVAVAQANPIVAITQAKQRAGMQEAAVAVATTKQQENKSKEPLANTNLLKAAPSAVTSPVPAVASTQPLGNCDPDVWAALSQAAVLAADKHLAWDKMKRKRSEKSDLARSFPTQDSVQAKKAKVKPSSSQHSTGHRDAIRFEIPGMTAKNTVESQYSQQPEERRGSLSLSSGRDSSTHSVKRRRSSASGTGLAPPGGPFATGMNATLHTPDQIALLAAALNRQQLQLQQSGPALTYVPGLSKALHDSAPSSNPPRNADKPMTYLVRQLLGQIPVDRNDPAFVLSPDLVKNASTKIQMVVDKLIEAAVKRTKEKWSTASAEDPDAKLPEDVESEIQILSQFSQERAIHLLEQNKIIAELQQKLDENLIVINEKRNHLESLRLRAKINGKIPTAAGLTDDSDHDETVRTLVQKLHRVIATVQKLKKDIDAYRLVAKQDEVELQQKDDVIKLLRAMIETENTLGRQVAKEASASATHATSPQHEDKQAEIALLMKDVDNLKDSLQKQRGNVEHRMKAYMRAAVQALKKQSGQKRKRSVGKI